MSAVPYFIESNPFVYVSWMNWNFRPCQTTLILRDFYSLWSTHGVSRRGTLTLCVSRWSGCSFSENTKLCVAKLVTNSNPTVLCISINQVDDGTEQGRKCMHCMIITVPWLRCTGWFVVYLCLSNGTTIDVQLLVHWCQDEGKTTRLWRNGLVFVAEGI